MQYRYSLPVKKEVRTGLGLALRLAVFGAVMAFLYSHITSSEFAWYSLNSDVLFSSPLIWVSVLLIPLNLGFEAAKWHYIVSARESVSFRAAFRGVLAGLACGLVTPRAVGDYAGRLATLTSKRKLAFTGSLIISRLTQLAVTLLFGSIGVWFLMGTLPAIICFITAPAGLMVIYFFMKNARFPGRRYVEDFLEQLQEMRIKDLCILSLLSVSRYLVFCCQFVLILSALTSLELPVLIGGVTWVFLAKSVLPSINFLGDLGVREFSAVYFFSAQAVDTVPVIAGSLALWCMNIAIPALAGSIILMWKKWS